MVEPQDRSGWMLDELGHAGEEHLDPDYVGGYDRKAGYDPASDLQILRGLGLTRDSVVVDIGAGTGEFALAVAPHCERVVAAEISPAMLDLMRAKVEESGLGNVDFVRAGFLTYDHQEPAPDFIYSRNTLHHLPDFWKALALQRVASMLKPGGVLLLHDLVYSFEPDETSDVFESWLAGAVEQPEEGFTRAELETHIRGEYSTFSWMLEPMLERAGFEIRDARHRPSRTYSAYICVR